MTQAFRYRFSLDDEVIGVFYVSLLKQVLETEGYSLKACPINLEDPSCYRRRISLKQITRCLCASLSEVPPGIGLKFGPGVQVMAADTLGQLVMASPNVRSALNYMLEFRLLMAMSFDVGVELKASTFKLYSKHYCSSKLPLCFQYFITEALFSSFLSGIRWLTGKEVKLSSLSFPYAKPCHFAQYESYFNCTLKYETDVHELSFDQSYLDTPILTANAALEKLKVDHCRTVHALWKRKFCIIQQVNDILMQHYPDFPAIEEVAHQLGVSRSSLYRKLSERKTSYQCLINKFKRDQSINLLKETNMSVESVAEHLGFSDASSFRRAFKSWTGYQPSAIREQGKVLQ